MKRWYRIWAADGEKERRLLTLAQAAELRRAGYRVEAE